jgi:hypothetical protein
MSPLPGVGRMQRFTQPAVLRAGEAHTVTVGTTRIVVRAGTAHTAGH